MRLAGHVARMGVRFAYRVMVARPGRKRQFGRQKRRWKNNIKIDLHEVEWRGMDWFAVAQDRDRWRTLVNAVKDNITIYIYIYI
jgi:hypothetical protein